MYMLKDVSKSKNAKNKKNLRWVQDDEHLSNLGFELLSDAFVADDDDVDADHGGFKLELQMYHDQKISFVLYAYGQTDSP